MNATVTYHCSECGNEVESEGLSADEAMACEVHPTAVIDSVVSTSTTAVDERR